MFLSSDSCRLDLGDCLKGPRQKELSRFRRLLLSKMFSKRKKRLLRFSRLTASDTSGHSRNHSPFIFREAHLHSLVRGIPRIRHAILLQLNDKTKGFSWFLQHVHPFPQPQRTLKGLQDIRHDGREDATKALLPGSRKPALRGTLNTPCPNLLGIFSCSPRGRRRKAPLLCACTLLKPSFQSLRPSRFPLSEAMTWRQSLT